MQGKQFVVGKARTINGVHFDNFDEANERLQDYGCLHYKTPIICGISEPRYSPEELKRLNEQNAKRYTIDGKEYSGYEVTQMQRRLESSVRKEKTTRDLAKASGDNALVKRCNERIKAYQGKYNEISEITGIQGDKKRMSVPRGTATVKGTTPTQKKVDAKPTKIAREEETKQFLKTSLKGYDTDKISEQITSFESKYKGTKEEHAIVLDKKGNIKQQNVGSKKSVPADAKNGEIIVHNHPLNSYEKISGTFSPADLKGVLANTSKGVVATGEEGTYYFLKTEGMEDWKLLGVLEKAIDNGTLYMPSHNTMDEWLKKRAEKYGFIYKFIPSK
jgi:hypothetical protein